MTAIHWLNPISGSFTNAADWSGGVVPGASDDAFLDASGATPYTVTLTNSGIQFVNTLQTASTATLDIVNGDLSALHGAINAGTIVVGQGSVFFQANGALVNTGSIYAENGGSLYLNGTASNSGTISLSDSSSSIDFGNATLTGGGVISLSHANVFGGPDHETNSLTNVDNTIEGTGNIVEFLDFTNGAAGVVDAVKGRLTFYVHNLKITNAGLIEATDGGNCLIRSVVKNSGTLMANGGTLTLDAAVTGSGSVDLAAGAIVIENAGASETVFFTGKSGVLELTQSQTFAGQLSGFSRKGKTTLDLRDIGFVGAGDASFSGTSASGVLTVTDGNHTAHITLKGDYLDATFVASSDGAGGTDVVATSGAASAPPHRLVAAMAGLGGSAGEAIHPGQAWTAREPALARPHAIA